MEDNYSVIWKVHNRNTGIWETQVAWSGSDVRQAKFNFHSEFSRLTESKEFDFVMTLLTSAWGNTQSDFLDERLGNPESGWPSGQQDVNILQEENITTENSEE